MRYPQRLLLFDIDGTLLRLGGPSGKAIARTIQELFGTVEPPTFTVSFSGKTDRRILRELLHHANLLNDDFETLFQRFLARYPVHFASALAEQSFAPLPGVKTLIERLADDSRVQLGIVTGNCEPTGWMKLDVTGLRSFFPFGAFGSEHEDRPELVRLAIQRGCHFAGRPFAPEDIFVIGDSPHDITSARPFGATAVAVATGPHSAADLQEHAPEFLFDHFEETENVLAVLCPST